MVDGKGHKETWGGCVKNVLFRDILNGCYLVPLPKKLIRDTPDLMTNTGMEENDFQTLVE